MLIARSASRKVCALVLMAIIMNLIQTVPKVTAQANTLGNEYVLQGENVSYMGIVKVGQSDYSVYEYGGGSNQVSNYLVFDTAGHRVLRQSCFFWSCSDNGDLQKVVFSVLSYKYASSDNGAINNKLQSIYDLMIDTAHKKAITDNWDSIRQAIQLLVDSATLVPVRVGIIEFDISTPLKQLALDHGFLAPPPSWDDVLSRFRDYMQSIKEISLFESRSQISYDYEVNHFFGELGAIQQLTMQIDAKTGTSLTASLGQLNLNSVASTLWSSTVTEISAMDSRNNQARMLAVQAQNSFNSDLDKYAGAIHNAMTKDMSLDSYKSSYCTVRGNVDGSLLNKEMYKSFENQVTTAEAQLQTSAASLSSVQQQRSDVSGLSLLGAWWSQFWWQLGFRC